MKERWLATVSRISTRREPPFVHASMYVPARQLQIVFATWPPMCNCRLIRKLIPTLTNGPVDFLFCTTSHPCSLRVSSLSLTPCQLPSILQICWSTFFFPPLSTPLSRLIFDDLIGGSRRYTAFFDVTGVTLTSANVNSMLAKDRCTRSAERIKSFDGDRINGRLDTRIRVQSERSNFVQKKSCISEIYNISPSNLRLRAELNRVANFSLF